MNSKEGKITATTLMKPTGINELYQAAFTQLPIANHKRHFVMAVLDCFSRYLLVLRVSPTRTTADLIKGLDQALAEARLVSDLPTDRTITLVTDTGPSLDAQDLLGLRRWYAVPLRSRRASYLPRSRYYQTALMDTERRRDQCEPLSQPR